MDPTKSEQLIVEYCASLKSGPAGRETIERDRDKLRFFFHAYVAEEWPRDLDRVDSEIVRDFLGNWFLRNIGGSRADLTSYLNTFRRFYDFLYLTGRISAPEHEDLVAVCGSRGYFFARYEEYHHPGPDAWEEFSTGGVKDGDPAPTLNIDRQLWMLIKNLGRPEPGAVLNFMLFLDYLAHFPVRLTPGLGYIPLAHLRRMNQRFSLPEDLPPRSNMDHSRRIRWFLRLAEALDLVKPDKTGRLLLQKRTEIFFDLDPGTMLCLLIDGTWNRLPWQKIGAAPAVKVSKWAYDHRDGFASLLADLPADREWMLDHNPANDDPDALLTRFLRYHRVVSFELVYCLRELGLLDYTRARSGTLKSLTLSDVGRLTMNLYARRARRNGQSQEKTLEALSRRLGG